jgi:hypothetical protein
MSAVLAGDKPFDESTMIDAEEPTEETPREREPVVSG